MIDRAMAYLDANADPRTGAKCLIGIVYLKEGRADDSRVAEALEAAKGFANQTNAQLVNFSETYTLALVTMFLCELDPNLYRDEIEKLLHALWQRQLGEGAWTYGRSGSPGDTSQSQYAVLACWTAHRAGFDVPSSAVQRICQWLIDTQRENGAFAYQPAVRGNERESVAAAGLGSMYICSTLLGINKMVNASSNPQTIPKVFRPVPLRGSESLDVRLGQSFATDVRGTINKGNKWLAANYTVKPEMYAYYYLYSLERYQAFRALAEGKTEREPRWYNDGVEELRRAQLENGSWPFSGQSNSTRATVDACFAILFLQRNTQRSLGGGAFGEGLLVGGRGLPNDMRRVRMVDGRVVSAMERRSVSALAKMLCDPGSPDFGRLAAAGETLLLDGADASAEDQESLRRLARSRSADVRKLAVQALASQRNLDNVPTLIALLSDTDAEVARQARDALRQVSRKFNGFGLPENPTQKQTSQATVSWKKWYLDIRPNARLAD